jgi:DNA polymerase-3 subunit epsilon
MIIAGIDLEGGGLGKEIDVSNDRITEIGLAVWDTTGGLIRTWSCLVWEEGVPFALPNIQRKTGITEAMLRSHGRTFRFALQALLAGVRDVDAWMAFNGTGYDLPMLRAEAKRQEVVLPDIQVIDPLTDVDWPEDITTRAQNYLAADHGILNPFPHRALPDVLTMMQLTSKYDPQQMLTWAKSPTVWLKAVVPFEQKDLAKDLLYRWNQDEYPKAWTKKVKELNVAKEQEAARKAGFTAQAMHRV